MSNWLLRKQESELDYAETDITRNPGESYLTLTPTNTVLDAGDRKFWLKLCNSQGMAVDGIPVVSGLPRKSWELVLPEDDFAGSGRCLVMGKYLIGAIEIGEWGDAIGNFWVSLIPQTVTNGRGDFGIHPDANRYSDFPSPGTAGCVGLLSLGDPERLRKWLSMANRPRYLYTNYGLLRGVCNG